VILLAAGVPSAEFGAGRGSSPRRSNLSIGSSHNRSESLVSEDVPGQAEVDALGAPTCLGGLPIPC
jgi:hypothetical protein